MEKSVIFLPLIITSQCQPMNQAVTEIPKKTSWHRLLHSRTCVSYWRRGYIGEFGKNKHKGCCLLENQSWCRDQAKART